MIEQRLGDVLVPMICERCGGSINRRELRCEHCGTAYERINRNPAVQYIVDRSGTHRIRTEVRISREMLVANPEGATKFTLDRMRQELADALLSYMKLTVAEDYENNAKVFRGEVKVVVPV